MRPRDRVAAISSGYPASVPSVLPTSGPTIQIGRMPAATTAMASRPLGLGAGRHRRHGGEGDQALSAAGGHPGQAGRDGQRAKDDRQSPAPVLPALVEDQPPEQGQPGDREAGDLEGAEELLVRLMGRVDQGRYPDHGEPAVPEQPVGPGVHWI